jgi:S1-C subfamily serine protease
MRKPLFSKSEAEGGVCLIGASSGKLGYTGKHKNLADGDSDSELPFGKNAPSPGSLKPILINHPLLPLTGGGTSEFSAEQAAWHRTLEISINAIVSIRCNQVRNFDTEQVGAYDATGFIVDAHNGIILSNRHVVNPGPIVATATLADYEEVAVWPCYRDPVHDYGFFRFDPNKVKFMHLVDIPLTPEAAKVGTDVRVVGNDASA